MRAEDKLRATLARQRELEAIKDAMLKFSGVLYATGIDNTRPSVQGGKLNGQEEALVRYADVVKALTSKAQGIEQDVKECIAIIDTLECPKERAVLIRRYIMGEDWQTVADNVNYDIRYTLKLHADALKKLDI